MIYILWGAQFNDCNFFECLIKLYLQSADTTHYMTFGSGIVGGILGYPLVAMCGKLVAFMISLVVTVTLVFIVANISVRDMANAASRKVNYVREVSEQRVAVRRARKEAEKREYEEQPLYKSDEIDIPIFQTPARDEIDVPLDEPKGKRKKKKRKIESGIDIDIVDSDEQNANFEKTAGNGCCMFGPSILSACFASSGKG